MFNNVVMFRVGHRYVGLLYSMMEATEAPPRGREVNL